jgi:hypothetical protein
MIHYLTILFNLRHHMIPSIQKHDLPPWRVNTLYLVLLSTVVRPICTGILLCQQSMPSLCIKYFLLHILLSNPFFVVILTVFQILYKDGVNLLEILLPLLLQLLLK